MQETTECGSRQDARMTSAGDCTCSSCLSSVGSCAAASEAGRSSRSAKACLVLSLLPKLSKLPGGCPRLPDLCMLSWTLR